MSGFKSWVWVRTAPSATVLVPNQRELRRLGQGGSFADEVREQVFATWSQDRLGVELHAFNVEFTVPKSHDQPVVGLGRHLQARRKRRAIDDQRVIPGGDERIRKIRENALAAV